MTVEFLSIIIVLLCLLFAGMALWSMGLKDFVQSWIDASRRERELKRQVKEEVRRRY